MAFNANGGIKVVREGKGFVHPLTIEDLLNILADAKYKLEEVPRILDITKKLQSEYKLLKEHSK